MFVCVCVQPVPYVELLPGISIHGDTGISYPAHPVGHCVLPGLDSNVGQRSSYFTTATAR